MTTDDLRPHAISREVYGTITVTSVLIVYDGWGTVTMLDAIVVITGPVIAMYIGHCFAATLAGQVARGRPLTRGELLATARAESGFLLLAVPPLVVLVVLTTAGARLSDAIRVIIWVSAASLGFWGGFAARRAGSAGWRVARGVLGGLLVGGIVLALQVFLQPGEAVSNGVAATGGRPAGRQAEAYVQRLRAAGTAAVGVGGLRAVVVLGEARDGGAPGSARRAGRCLPGSRAIVSRGGTA